MADRLYMNVVELLSDSVSARVVITANVATPTTNVVVVKIATIARVFVLFIFVVNLTMSSIYLT
jgi:hypothetical protein